MQRETMSARAAGRWTGLLGLAFVLGGLTIGGAALVRYLQPDLGTSLAIRDAHAIKEDALAGIARGAIAATLGLMTVVAGAFTARRAANVPSIPPAAVSPATSGVDRRVILPDTAPFVLNDDHRSAFATHIWTCRLAVDLQRNRLDQPGLGAEGEIDARLYGLALRNLLHAAGAAQRMTRSVEVIDATEKLLAKAADPQAFRDALERLDSYTSTTRARKNGDAAEPIVTALIEFNGQGAMLRIGSMTVGVAAVTEAADILANVSIGALTDVRTRAVGPKAKRANDSS